MPKIGVQFLLTLTITTLSIKIFGDVQMNVVSLEPKLSRSIWNHIFSRKKPDSQNLCEFSCGCLSPSMVRKMKVADLIQKLNENCGQTLIVGRIDHVEKIV